MASRLNLTVWQRLEAMETALGQMFDQMEQRFAVLEQELVQLRQQCQPGSAPCLQQSSEPHQLGERPLQALLQTYHNPVLSRPLER